MMPSFRDSQRGFSMIELLVVIVVSSLMVIALTLFVGRGFIVSREQFEQVHITEDARKELERISEAIRDAQFVEIDGSAGTNINSSERNIQTAKSDELVMYANIDDDAKIEKVRYFVQGADKSELARAFTEPSGTPPDLPKYDSGESAPQVLVRSLRNGTEPVFRYFTAGGVSELTPSASGLSSSQLAQLGRVRLHLIIDVNTQQNPTAADIYTEATPRSVLTPNCFGDDCPVPACSVEDLAKDPSNINRYISISELFDECQGHCNGGGGSCPWTMSVTQDGSYIHPRCFCETRSKPGYAECVAGDLAGCKYEKNVEVAKFTQFYRECWDETTLGAAGTPYCSSGSGGFGECACLPIP